MKNFVTQGGRDNLRSAGRQYSSARGGRKGAIRTSTAGRGATVAVARFLTNVASGGLEKALDALGLVNLIGSPVEVVLAEIVNKLAPDGATLEDVIARKTVSSSIDAVFERYDVEGNIERLNNMDGAGIEEAVKVSVAEFIFQRWMLDLGKRVEEFAINAYEACKIEQEVRAYVFEATNLDLRGHDLLNADWSSPEYQQLIDKIFEEAYGFLEDSQ